MLNSFWEEQDMKSSIGDFHEEQMEKLGLPNWIKDIKCPFCKKELPLRSVRNVQFCFNTRNFGEVAVEILCDACSKMDTVYFRVKLTNINDFISMLDDTCAPTEDPIIEEDMYKLQYNNIMDKMFSEKRNS